MGVQRSIRKKGRFFVVQHQRLHTRNLVLKPLTRKSQANEKAHIRQLEDSKGNGPRGTRKA